MISNRIIVEKMVNGGYGLAREDNGQVILLRGCLPGEELSYTVTEKRKNTLFGTPKKFFRRHRERITPPCPYYGQCGGCNLQHASYTRQLQIKEDIVKEMLQPHSHLCLPVVPSPVELGYRQRIRLQVQNGQMGFLRFRSKDIVPVESCLLAHPLINKSLKALNNHKEFRNISQISTEIEFLYDPAEKHIVLLFHLQRPPRPADKKRCSSIIEETACISRIFFKGKSFALQAHHVKHQHDSKHRLLTAQFINSQLPTPFSLSWEVGGFCQVNIEQNQNLIDYVITKGSHSEEAQILDLFCGMGNFSIPLAQTACKIVGVESQGAAIRCAKYNSSRATLDNITFIRGESREVCSQLAEEGRSYELTIVDPPRQGIPGLHQVLANITSKKIIYISCDPATLARDLTILQTLGFKLSEVQPFDMFPQTHHVETAAVLERD